MKTYCIRELSNLFSLPASALRYYESEGLLTNVQRNSSGQRIYTEEHIERIKCIHCFKRTGMTISQLRSLFQYEENEAEHIDEIIRLLETQEQSVYERLTQLKSDFLHIQRKIKYYKTVKDAFAQGTSRPVWTETAESDQQSEREIGPVLNEE